MSVPFQPPGYHSVTPYLVVRGAAQALDFYARAFGAVEVLRLPMGGLIGHAEIRIGDSIVMLADEMEGYAGPQTIGGSPVSLMIYTKDVDAMFDRAVAAGATVRRPVADQFYGDRTGVLVDPYGHVWSIATHIEDVSEDEIARRLAAMSASQWRLFLRP
ncbi:MAG: VOC family protein [Burkholderiales bacterium]|nr:VOC family protein [Burkholderiales bacterium]